METIRLYIDNMFLGIEETTRVKVAKAELLAMMEDKYHELKDQGLNENEAVGQVISEFGNLEELAEDLGLEKELGGKNKQAVVVDYIDEGKVSDTEVDNFLADRKKLAPRIALGVALIILSPIAIMFVGRYTELSDLGDNSPILLFGLIPLLLIIGVAVFMLIFAGMSLSNWEYLEKQMNVLSPSKTREIKAQREHNKRGFAVKISSAVALIIVGVILVIIAGFLEDMNPYLPLIGVTCILICVALAVAIFITAGMHSSSFDILLNEGSYSKSSITANSKVSTFAGPYWIIITGIWLVSGWITNQWHLTWIIFPASGILFAAIAAAISGREESKK